MKSKTLLTTFSFLLLFSVPSASFAAEVFTPLVGIPGVTDPGLSFGDYINALYALSISIAALMAVIKIIIAGMKYMLSDIVTSKSEAISDIQGAIFGLIIVISAVLILTVINPQLGTVNIFLEPIISTAKPVGPAIPPGNIVTKPGYTYAVTKSVPDFNTICESRGGFYKIESDSDKIYDVCYNPLSPAMISEIETTYVGNIGAIKKRYQTSLIPNLRSDAKDLIANKVGTDIDKVLLVVMKRTPGNWVDRRLRDETAATCFDLQRAQGGGVSFREVTVDVTYFACVKN